MLVFTDWLKDYTDINVDMDSFCERMVMSGSNIETVLRYGTGIEKVVVGKIISIEKHPNADKLLICMLDIGNKDLLQIVTGAPNVFEGAYVPVILHGGKLPDGTVIKKGKLRGVESNGMLCSARELGYEDKVIPVAHRDGIWILEEEYPPGQDIVEALGLAGKTVDFEITPNRPDCLSMIGIAREAAAVFGGSLKYPDTECIAEVGRVEDYIEVEIKKPELCRRYTARIVKDVRIAQSPWWLQKRLMYAGMRPINNIVDITNYVMLEYGQPIHAFDIRNVKGNKIIVDTAKEGELFTTLDGSVRTLSEGMLLIKDRERGIAVAGVMGGLNSEIKEDTDTIIIESANFNGDSIRLTSKKLGLRTEASSRFEKGIDPNLTGAAADRVCRLIEIIGAGTVVGGCADVYPALVSTDPITLRVDRANKVLGTDISREKMDEFLRSLEMQTVLQDGSIVVTPPTVRQDLLTEIDLIEEIGRIYGFDRIPPTLHKGSNEAKKTRDQILRDIARDALVGMGASEIQTYSFVSPKGLDYIKADENAEARKLVRLINPLGEENSVMRSMLTPNMMEVLGRNYSRNIPEVKAFEIGSVFIDTPLDSGLPKEEIALCAGCYGQSESFFTLKGMVAEMLFKLGIKDVKYKAESSINTYHPGRCAKIIYNDIELGVIGEIHPDVLEQYDFDIKIYCCELNFNRIAESANTEHYYRPLPKYPSTSRDIALLVNEEINVADIEAIIKRKGTDLLESAALFDVYRGKQVPEGQKSVAFNLTYRASDRTLTDEEVMNVHEKVLTALKEELGAVLREI